MIMMRELEKFERKKACAVLLTAISDLFNIYLKDMKNSVKEL